MQEISLSEVRKRTVKELKEIMPVIVTADGEAFAYLAGLDDIIILSDLHPRVANMLKMQEKRARSGMSAPVKLVPKEAE